MEQDSTHQVPQLGHIEALKDLALVGGTVSVHGEGGVLVGLAHVLLSECDSRSDGDLRADDAVTSEEGLCEDVHGTALAVRHAALSTEQLGNDTLDRPAAKDGERVASVGRDDLVVWLDAGLEADRDGLLPDGEVAESANHLLLVQLVGSHLHPAHRDHLLVQLDELVLGHRDFVLGDLEAVTVEGVLGEVDLR